MTNGLRLRRLGTNPKGAKNFLAILLGLFGLHQLTHSYLSLDHQIIEKEDWLRGVIKATRQLRSCWDSRSMRHVLSPRGLRQIHPVRLAVRLLVGDTDRKCWTDGCRVINFFCQPLLLARLFIERKFANQLAWLNRAISADGGFLSCDFALASRALHVSELHVWSKRDAPRTFWWATQLGMLPGCMIFAYAGSRLPTLREFSDQGLISVLDPWLFSALLASGLIPITARWIYRRFPVRLK